MNDHEKEFLHDAGVLQMSWRDIESHLGDFSQCLERESEFASGRLKLRIMRVLSLLQSEPSLEEILAHRDALAALLPLLTHRDQEISIESAVRKGVQRIAGNDVYRRNWLQLFWYPALVTIIAFFVCVLLSFTAAPEFELTLQEFAKTSGDVQIKSEQFPWVTRFSLGAASFLRVMWLPIVLLFLFLTVGIRWINNLGRKNNPSGLGWWDDRNVSVRGALAIWSDHLSSLLQVGVSQTDAFQLASREAPKKSLRQLSAVLAARDRMDVDNQFKPYFPLRKYALLDYALKLNPLPAKAATLQEVSAYYRDRDRHVSTWWMSWLSSALLWLTGVLVLLIFLSVFIPLQHLISEITGLVSGVVGIGN